MDGQRKTKRNFYPTTLPQSFRNLGQKFPIFIYYVDLKSGIWCFTVGTQNYHLYLKMYEIQLTCISLAKYCVWKFSALSFLGTASRAVSFTVPFCVC